MLYHLKPYVPKKVAERVGFEPTALDESPVFKTGSLNHSDISPHLFQSEARTILPYFLPDVNRSFEISGKNVENDLTIGENMIK